MKSGKSKNDAAVLNRTGAPKGERLGQAPLPFFLSVTVKTAPGFPQKEALLWKKCPPLPLVAQKKRRLGSGRAPFLLQ
ncbi:hypothetical protein WMO24_00795 [Ruthenibacterium sp. CLA-JM-H11]|uniref:Uncharacterized protein n=1 Tax=Ruthenibacterium intestinale TaxID=3133163 RepID=A0ABV1GB27_9FIRM